MLVAGVRLSRTLRAAEGRSRVPADMSYQQWLKRLTPAGANDTMSAGDIPSWPPRDKAKIIPKEEYAKLRAMADAHGIALSGVKKFDGYRALFQNCQQRITQA